MMTYKTVVVEVLVAVIAFLSGDIQSLSIQDIETNKTFLHSFEPLVDILLECHQTVEY